ncbi:MAG: hypothetical protein N2449_01230, partial [Bacteroidales bacterium]|nr:hypothetical protein [Bacteroidales bacterium]
MKKIVGFVVLLTIAKLSYTQLEATRTIWSAKLNNLKAIIENKGQEKEINGRKILYAYYGSKEKYFFTEKGIIIRIDTLLLPGKLASAYYKLLGEDEEIFEKAKLKSHYLFAEWQEANDNIQIIPTGQTEGYYTFRDHSNICYGYNRLIYKNVYPQIDIEYLLPKDSSGIKYNIILHPGADVSQ